MEKIINTNPMVVNQRRQIYITRIAFEKARQEQNFKKSSDLRRRIRRMEKDLNIAIINLRNEGWK